MASVSQGRRRHTQKPRDAGWTAAWPRIMELYVNEGLELSQVQAKMREESGFHRSIKRYKVQLFKCGIDGRPMTGVEYEAMFMAYNESLERDGTKVDFEVLQGRKIKRYQIEDIERELARRRLKDKRDSFQKEIKRVGINPVLGRKAITMHPRNRLHMIRPSVLSVHSDIRSVDGPSSEDTKHDKDRLQSPSPDRATMEEKAQLRQDLYKVEQHSSQSGPYASTQTDQYLRDGLGLQGQEATCRQRLPHGHNAMAVTALINHDLPITTPGNHGPTRHIGTDQSRYDAGNATAVTPSQQLTFRSAEKQCKQAEYTEEEVMFLWYHRIHLHQGWDEVVYCFNSKFNPAREKAGLQCRLYRLLESNGMGGAQQVGNRITECNGDVVLQRQRYGLVAMQPQRYSWMTEADLAMGTG